MRDRSEKKAVLICEVKAVPNIDSTSWGDERICNLALQKLNYLDKIYSVCRDETVNGKKLTFKK